MILKISLLYVSHLCIQKHKHNTVCIIFRRNGQISQNKQLSEKRMINTPNMLHRRIIEKSGELRTKLYGTEHVTLFSWKYVKDFFISIINLSWITIYMTFFSIIFGSWFVFAVIWCFIFWLHGDFGDDEDPSYEYNNRKCATNILGFTSCFLFSGNRFYIPIS